MSLGDPWPRCRGLTDLSRKNCAVWRVLKAHVPFSPDSFFSKKTCSPMAAERTAIIDEQNASFPVIWGWSDCLLKDYCLLADDSLRSSHTNIFVYVFLTLLKVNSSWLHLSLKVDLSSRLHANHIDGMSQLCLISDAHSHWDKWSSNEYKLQGSVWKHTQFRNKKSHSAGHYLL